MAKQKKHESVPENSEKKQLSRRDFLKASGAVIASAVLFNALVACTPKTTTVTTTSTATTTVVPKTIKIGFEAFYGSNLALDMMHGIELMVAQDNQKGGLNIGGEKYIVQLVEYDNQNTQAGEVAAVNRLVFEDKVHFIVGEGTFANGWFNITEENKVLVFTTAAVPQMAFAPNLHYSFSGSCFNPLIPIFAGWYCDKYPDLVKNVVLAATDDQFGHMIVGFKEAAYAAFGGKTTAIYFPGTAQDLSSLGTKIVSLKPTSLEAVTMADQTQGLVFNAARQAGYTGMIFGIMVAPSTSLKSVMSADALEGLMDGATPTEFEPALTQEAKDFKAAWIAKYGKWEDPNITFASNYPCIRTALVNAGSTDPDAVAAVLNSGMKFETPSGSSVMISRPDLGNNRAVDSLSMYYIKKTHNGQPVLVDTITVEQGLDYFKRSYQNAPPAGGPPPGGAP